MEKRYSNPHLTGVLLLLVGITALWPARAAEASPDSLLAMPLPQKLTTITQLYGEALKEDTARADSLALVLGHFVATKGTRTDRLVTELALLRMDLYRPDKKSGFPQRINRFLKESKELNEPLLMGKAHDYAGMFYHDVSKEYGLSFWHYAQAIEFLKGMNPESYPYWGAAIYRIARVYYDFFDYETAIRLGEIVMADKNTKIVDTHVFTACMSGMSYLYLHQHRLARKYFEKGLDYTRRAFTGERQQAWEGILSGNIGLVLYAQSDYERALPYLERGLRLTYKAELWDNSSPFGAKLARIYLQRRQLQAARSYAQLAIKAAKHLQTDHEKEASAVVQFLVEPYQVMTAYYRAAGNYRSALLYADSAAAANDDWKRQIDVMLKHKAEIAMEMERYESRQVLLEKEKQQQLMQRNFLLALMGLSLLVVALLYRHQHTRNRHRQEQLVKEKQMAQAELQNAQILLDQLYQTVQQKSQLIEQLETGIESDRGSTVLAQAVQPHLLMELRRSVLLTEQNWQSFVELFEKVHSGFFARLKEQLPDLTPAETRFMALSRLGYSAREQAGMLGVSTGAIRQYRYTIRRKLALGEEVDMKEIAGKI